MGSQSHVDEEEYINATYTEDQKTAIVKNGEQIIEAAGEEYKSVFQEEYKHLMQQVFTPPQVPAFSVGFGGFFFLPSDWLIAATWPTNL